MGNATPKGIYDSCYIEKDTIIHNDTFYKLYSPNQMSTNINYSIVHDSLHYIVDYTGRIIFSSQDFTTIFFEIYHTLNNGGQLDTFYRSIGKMENKDLPFTTDAGTFITSDFRVWHHMYPAFNGGGTDKYAHYRYAEKVGLVTQTIAINSASPIALERRLVRYHVN